MNIQAPQTDTGRNFRDVIFITVGTGLGLVAENIEAFSFLGENTELFSLIVSSLVIVLNRFTRSQRG